MIKKITLKTFAYNLFYLSVLLLLSYSFNAHAKTNNKSKKSVNLASISAISVDLKTGSVLLSKNSKLVVPIASITKLMTAMVILDAKLSLKEKIRFSRADKKAINNYFSRIRIGSELSRADTLRIALMSSENLASTALARTYPGGRKAFIRAMNAKAKLLGMRKTRFVNATGLSEKNISTAADLAKMVRVAAKYPLIKKYTTTQTYTARFKKPRYILGYTNSNLLIRTGNKDIKLSKTGYLDEAGRCLTIVRKVNNKDVVMVLLDSYGKRSPVGDANRIKKWLQTGKQGKVKQRAKNYEQMKLSQYFNGK